MNYIKNPQSIYKESFSIINQEVELSSYDDITQAVITRMIHACGMTDIIDDIRFSPQFAKTLLHSLDESHNIIVDVTMVQKGIIQKNINSPILCTLNDPEVGNVVKRINNTRSASAVELWRDSIKGSIVVIGNAPTTLFYLLELLLKNEIEKPSVIVATPVGFVGAVESKQMLHDADLDIEYITLLGRKGGSAIASSVVNAVSGYRT